jgi:ABC-type multidrug transport system permease subunit
MSLARGALALALKEFRHMVHEPVTLGLTVGMPLLQLILFGFALETRIQHVPTAVLNRDRHSDSRALADGLARSNVFAVTHEVSSLAELKGLMRSGRVKTGIEIPEDYSAARLYRRPAGLRVWIDSTDGITATQITIAAEGLGLRESMTRLISARVAPVEVRARSFFASDRRSATTLLPGLIAILLQMIPMLLTALSIAKEKERGTWDQVLVTPLSAGSVMAGKLMSFGCAGFAEGCVLLLLMSAVFKVPVQGSIPLALAAIALFLLPALGLGLLITARARHQAEALQCSYLVFLPSVMLSGLLFPRESMPAPLRWFSSLLPTTYSVDIMRGIVNRGASAPDLLPQFAAVAIIAAVLLMAGFRLASRARG